jgi:hypothetical protein
MFLTVSVTGPQSSPIKLVRPIIVVHAPHQSKVRTTIHVPAPRIHAVFQLMQRGNFSLRRSKPVSLTQEYPAYLESSSHACAYAQIMPVTTFTPGFKASVYKLSVPLRYGKQEGLHPSHTAPALFSICGSPPSAMRTGRNKGNGPRLTGAACACTSGNGDLIT